MPSSSRGLLDNWMGEKVSPLWNRPVTNGQVDQRFSTNLSAYRGFNSSAAASSSSNGLPTMGQNGTGSARNEESSRGTASMDIRMNGEEGEDSCANMTVGQAASTSSADAAWSPREMSRWPMSENGQGELVQQDVADPSRSDQNDPDGDVMMSSVESDGRIRNGTKSSGSSSHSTVESTPSETTLRPMFDEVDEQLLDTVFFNDLLLAHIISFITDIKDRILIERVSKRLRYLSQHTPMRLSRDGDTLHVDFQSYNDNATVQFDCTKVLVPVCTAERMYYESLQPVMTPMLEAALRGVASRYARQVRKVTIGGSPPEATALFVESIRIVVTADLLEFVVDHFPNVYSICFEKCNFEQGAQEFCLTEKWAKYGEHISDLKLARNEATSDSSGPLMNIVSPRLSSLSLSTFSCSGYGARAVEAMKKHNVYLKKCEIQMEEWSSSSVEECFSFLKSMSARTQELCLTLERGISDERPNVLFAILERLPELSNITELHILIYAYTQAQYDMMTRFMNHLCFFPSLRSLDMTGWRTSRELERDKERMIVMTRALANGLTRCRRLEELELSYFPSMDPELLSEVAAAIPSSIKVLDLFRIFFTDDQMKEILERTSLRVCKLREMPRLTARPLIHLLQHHHELEELSSTIPVNPAVARRVADVACTPRLKYLRLHLSVPLSKHDEDLIKPMFRVYDCSKESLYIYKFRVWDRLPGVAGPSGDYTQPPIEEMLSEPRRGAPDKDYLEW